MSKRLNKRQQRELEELEQLKAQEAKTVKDDGEEEEQDEEEDEDDGPAPINPFDALDAQRDDPDEDNDEEEPENAQVAAPKKSKKKKNKKKKKVNPVSTPAVDEADEASTSALPTPKKGRKENKVQDDGMDEVDKAIAELNLKYGSQDVSAGESSLSGQTPESKGFMAFRNLLAVDPKNLDSDAELRRFFGSKVITSTASTGSKNHRAGPSSKLRYTISKPKPTYPPATSLAGLGMRELKDEEVEEWYERRELEGREPGEKWFTFEHSGQWRETERQFMGAVRSHDPNELMALLQVYPWHVDTLLQMSEVYRLQSDIGAASDFAERALYAFDRCLIPTFSVSSGASRLDFDRVENRPMFTALHRIISYLGRRGCWVTAFNFAKLLFSLDPLGDPHGAAFWLDFLAVKSNNGTWLLSMFEQEHGAAVAFDGYPGMAYAKALALRADEGSSKNNKDHTRSEVALQTAIFTFPQVVPLLADKIGASLPDRLRSHPLFAVEAGYSDSPNTLVHLLSHIYVSRSEALWKDPDNLSFFESQISAAFSLIDSDQAKSDRDHVLSLLAQARDPVDEQLAIPLFVCRHVLCSESTSWLGFLPPQIRNKPFHAFDPLPPTTAISMYDNEYFAGVSPSSSRRGGGGSRAGAGGFVGELMGRMNDAMERYPDSWQERIAAVFRDMTGRREFAGVPEQERDNLLQQLLAIAGTGGLPQPQEGNGDMPGAFPGDAGGRDE